MLVKRESHVRFSEILQLFFFSLIAPSCAWASGGGPILLLFNGSVFIIGQIWIIGIEYFIFRRLLDDSKMEIFKDIVSANLQSTIMLAFILPFVIALVGLAGSFVPGQLGDLSLAIGTWVHDKSAYGKLPVYLAFVWFITLYFLTVIFEASIYRRRWKKRGYSPKVSPLNICFCTNTVSHMGLLIAILAIWHEIV